MYIFSDDISKFRKVGTYDYEFDEGGNLVFNVTSSKFTQHYVSIPLVNYVYDDSKIKSFYSLEFSEFKPTTIVSETVASGEMSDLEIQNQQLQEKLSVLTELADSNSTQSDILANKQVIIDLRIKTGQGNADRDFSDIFPYLPLSDKVK